VLSFEELLGDYSFAIGEFQHIKSTGKRAQIKLIVSPDLRSNDHWLSFIIIDRKVSYISHVIRQFNRERLIRRIREGLDSVSSLVNDFAITGR
jgi:hypothetical protein